jgi:hypothetical protein
LFNPEEYSDDSLRESISPVKANAGFFESHIGKWTNVQRWLRSHVGQRWSDINSKWVNRKKSGCEEYIYRHLEDRCYVEKNARIENGKFFDTKGDEITDGFAIVNDILYEVGQQRKRSKPRSVESRRWNYKVVWKNNQIFASINNIWYELKVEEIIWKWDDPYSLSKKDVFLDTRISAYKIKKKYDGEANLRELLYGKANLFCSAKRQLCKQEIRALDLRSITQTLDDGKTK